MTILSTHVGSLIRPPEVLAYQVRIERGEEIDRAGYEETLRTAVVDVVDRQIDTASTSSPTARWARPAGSRYLYERITGVEMRPIKVEGERPAAEP